MRGPSRPRTFCAGPAAIQQNRERDVNAACMQIFASASPLTIIASAGRISPRPGSRRPNRLVESRVERLVQTR